jgi:hypothetical protein
MGDTRSFSERMGLVQPRTVLQVESLDERLRSRLLNCFDTVGPPFEVSVRAASGSGMAFPHWLWDRFWGRSLRGFEVTRAHFELQGIFNGGIWNTVYDLLQFALTWHHHEWVKSRYIAACNQVLREELAGYLFVDGVIVQVTEPIEIEAIEDTLSKASPSAREHMRNALTLFADRDNPNYAKVIQEAVTAAEGQLQQLTGKSKVADGLAELKKAGGHHPAFLLSFGNLYGWASNDKTGIRHAGDGSSAPSQALAKVALVTCSAFVNYLEELRAKK